MSEKPYLAAPFFTLRVPMWSVEDFEKILAEENWIEALIDLYQRDTHLREAIAIASPSLHCSLQQRPLKDPQQVATSLFNYVVRMATRATPFGLFSFVRMGTWNEETTAAFDLKQVYKKARPDMEWVYAWVQKLYTDEKLFPALSVRANPLARLRGNRCVLNYVLHGEMKGKKPPKAISIRANGLVRAILSLAKGSILIDELWKELKFTLPVLEREKTLEVVRALLDNQILLPAIIPSLLSNSPFEELLSQLPPSTAVGVIAQHIHAYNQTLPGEGQLDHLQRAMQELAPSKTFIQVDSAYKGGSLTLPKAIASELERTLALLWKISSNHTQVEPIQGYLEKFIEKFGTHRTVPLLELLDLLPFKKSSSAEQIKSKFSQHWDRWLNQKWQSSLRENKQEIILSEKEIDQLISLADEKPAETSAALPAVDVFCKIFAKSPQQIDQGEFLILFSQLNWFGGSTLGRFLHLLDAEVQADLQEYYRQEEQLEPDAQFVEISYWPSFARFANVAIQPCLRSMRLDIGTGDSLSLEDIYVGVADNHFYLTLKEGGCEVIPRTGNLLNPDYGPEFVQFMREVNKQRHSLLYPFSWGKLDRNAVFLPRVRFQKVILSPAKWNLDGVLFIGQKLEQIILQFMEWAKKWNLPLRFLLVREDQHLLVDCRHPVHLNEIARKLKEGESLQFIEQDGSSWVETERGHHLTEIVCSFLKNPIYAKKNTFIPRPYLAVLEQHRIKLPGSEWLYLKLYLDDDEMDNFLVQQLAVFAEQLGCSGWYFVRYADPEKHIRFRVRFHSAEQIGEGLALIEEAARGWIREGLIKNMGINSYEREIERYGGEECINDAEALFCADSRGVVQLLGLSKTCGWDPIVLQTLSVIALIKDFDLDPGEIIGQQDPSALQGFRSHKRQLLTLAKTLEENSPFLEVSKLRLPILKKFQVHESKMRLDIYSSMLHMHCNRLGCDREIEKTVCQYAKEILLQLQYLNL